MKINIYLDDDRVNPPGFVRTFRVEETIQLLKVANGSVDMLSLDNDLGIPGKENEGREVVRWLCEQSENGKNFWPRQIRVHTENVAARDYMKGMIERYGNYHFDWFTKAYFINDGYYYMREE